MNARPLSASGRHAHYYSVSGFIDEMPINKNIVKITGKGGSTFVSRLGVDSLSISGIILF